MLSFCKSARFQIYYKKTKKYRLDELYIEILCSCNKDPRLDKLLGAQTEWREGSLCSSHFDAGMFVIRKGAGGGELTCCTLSWCNCTCAIIRGEMPVVLLPCAFPVKGLRA